MFMTGIASNEALTIACQGLYIDRVHEHSVTGMIVVHIYSVESGQSHDQLAESDKWQLSLGCCVV